MPRGLGKRKNLSKIKNGTARSLNKRGVFLDMKSMMRKSARNKSAVFKSRQEGERKDSYLTLSKQEKQEKKPYCNILGLEYRRK